MTQARHGESPRLTATLLGRSKLSSVQPFRGRTRWELPMRPILAVAIPVLSLIAISAAEAANPTLLAETGGFLLGNAHRCGVPEERVERAGKVIHDFIVIAAKDSNEVAAADSR